MTDAAIHRPDDDNHQVQPLGRAVTVFIVVSFGFSWLAWLPLVVDGPTTVMPWYFYLGSMGPALGAIVATLVLQQDGGPRSWARRTFSLVGTGQALAVVAASLLAYVGVGLLVEQATSGSLAKVSSIGLTSQVPGASAVLVALVWILTFGIGEETGWRGWLMPTLTGRFGYFTASLLVAGVWLGWHLPQFVFNTGFRNMGWATIGWVVALVAGSFWLGWLARLGRWSIVPVVLFHGGFDLLTSSDLGPAAFAGTASIMVMIQAAGVVAVLAVGRARAKVVGSA
ncbi:MAG: CPBP family intramembrane glutamic endopeptidase [Specibacter sp.]